MSTDRITEQLSPLCTDRITELLQRHRANPSAEIMAYGQEKTAETVRLARMNLAVHGLSGDIREGNSYYEDIHDSVGRFDFAMANPPFNVDKVDKDRLKDDHRFPFGLPRADNANYLWIQAFYSALNEKGRAGFVMHNSASDSEIEIRKKLLDLNNVDVLVATSSNLFYTVSLPATLWFLDKSRPQSQRRNSILFVDARHLYVNVDTAHREMTEAHITSVVEAIRRWRGESPDPYQDIPGLCRSVSMEEVARKNYSLNPKLYVEKNVNYPDLPEDPDFIANELADLHEEARSLQSSISEMLNIDVPTDRGVLQSMLKLLYRRWFLDRDFPPYLLQNEEDGEKVWPTKPFREVVQRYIGGSWGSEDQEPQNTERVTIIRGTDLSSANFGKLGTCPERYIKSSQLRSRLLDEGDLIMEVSGGGKDQSTGRSAYVSKALIEAAPSNLTCASFCKLIKIDAGILRPSLAYLHLQRIYDDKSIERYEVQSTGIKNFKFEYFLDEEQITVPPRELQDIFDEVAAQTFRLIHVLGGLEEYLHRFVMLSPAVHSEWAGLAGLNLTGKVAIEAESFALSGG